MLKLYENIKKYRKDKGMTQSELAKKMGYADKSAISKIESGKVDLPQSQIIKFAEALGVDPRELMDWGDSPVDLSEDSSEEQSRGLYYLNPETAQIAQQVYDDPDMRVLFDAAKDSKPEDIRMAANMLKRFKETNPDG